MPLPTWPTSVPHTPQLSSFQRLEHHRPAIVTEVEDGPDLMAVSSQTRIARFSYRREITASEYATLYNFFENDLAQGTGHFLMLVPAVGKTMELRRVYLEKGQWSDEPDADGIDFIISFTLCVFPASFTPAPE